MSLSQETTILERTAEESQSQSQDDLRPLDFEVLDSEDEEDADDPFQVLQRKRATTEPVQGNPIEQGAKRPKTAPEPTNRLQQDNKSKSKDLMSILLPDDYEGSMTTTDFSILQESTQMTSMVSGGGGSRGKEHDINSKDIQTLLETDETIYDVSIDQSDEPLEAISHNEFLEATKESPKKKSIGEFLEESDDDEREVKTNHDARDSTKDDVSYEDVEVEDEAEGSQSDSDDDEDREYKEEGHEEGYEEDLQNESKSKIVEAEPTKSQPSVMHEISDHTRGDANTGESSDGIHHEETTSSKPSTHREGEAQPVKEANKQKSASAATNTPQQRSTNRKSTLAELCSRSSPVPHRVGLSKRAHINHLHSYLSKK